MLQQLMVAAWADLEISQHAEDLGHSGKFRRAEPRHAEIKDRGRVRAMWQWARDLDRDNLLWREFCRPIEVETGSKEDLAIQLTEGWILGCSPTATNQ